MHSLAQAQANFIATINHGPDALDERLFNGPVDRVLLGLKAHANTISHARLVALEETFPLTRKALGEKRFNLLSREYAETVAARACDANSIGGPFVTFLQSVLLSSSPSGEGLGWGLSANAAPDGPTPRPAPPLKGRGDMASIIDLAAIEWAWLESYHAADVAAMSVADLAGLDEAGLLEMHIALHPSARLVAIHAPLAVEEMAGQQPAAILCIRPNAEVRLVALDQLQTELFDRAKGKKCTLGNLLAHTLEQAGERDPLAPILHLIGAGALVKAV